MVDTPNGNGPNGPNGGGGGNTGGGSTPDDVFAQQDTLIVESIKQQIGTLSDGQINFAKELLFQFVTQATFELLFNTITTIQGLLEAIETHNANVSQGPQTPPGGNQFGSDKIYSIFDNTDQTTNKTTVTSGLFTGGAATITSHFTASSGATSASYMEIFNANPDDDSTAQVQFAVGYAHINGSGSIGNSTKTTEGNRETAALYRQFRNVLLAPNEKRFKFTSSPSSSGHDDFFFIVFNRAQMREKVDPGNWEFHFSPLDSSATGSLVGNPAKLIDDSGATTNPDVNISGRVFNVVSGSIQSGVADIDTTAAASTTVGAPGLFYPDAGVIILNPDYISGSVGVTPAKAANTFGDNARKIANAVSKSRYTAARREEELTSKSYFCRARNDRYNFSSNPTYKTGSKTDSGDILGQFAVPSFKGDPRAYITQVGLYDGDLDLIAVAKLSQPILKSFSREAVVKVKLDY